MHVELHNVRGVSRFYAYRQHHTTYLIKLTHRARI